MDWQHIEEAASLVLRDGKLPVRSKEAIKRALATRNDPHSVLEALCVLDSLALNCGRTFRTALAAPKWMKRLTQCFTAVPQTAPAVAQLLANWELTFRGEELGASAHAARKQLQASSDVVPQPNHFAHDMREYFEQHIPFIGFQHGFDFLSAYSDADSSSPSQTGTQSRASCSGPVPDRSISEFQVGYLQDMSADVHNLGRCAAALEQHGPRPSHSESVVREGNALASKCCNWRACIQEWAVDELLSYSLADMLAMNDCLHAELDRWESVTRSLVLTQSMPMAVGVDMSFDGALQDHSQWFSPLGSSASRTGGANPLKQRTAGLSPCRRHISVSKPDVPTIKQQQPEAGHCTSSFSLCCGVVAADKDWWRLNGQLGSF
ncbi:g8456 [Coccomyxa viridis]|uniref:G8456 protein n=1 Tax=Coccomyxa viridis TaxID=1274662 RepID=A0ABP1G2Z1_9CHLO